MNQKPKHRLFTLEEYFRWESKSIIRHEFYRGRRRRLSGSPAEHALVTANVIAAFENACTFNLNQDFKGYTCDLLIEAQPQIHYTYADYTIGACKIQTKKLFGFEILTNPSLVVEVLSPLHYNYDLGSKFQHYKNIETFRDYLVIDSRQVKVFHYQKINENTWHEKTYDKLEDICSIKNLDVNISLADIYEHLEFKANYQIINKQKK